MTELEKKTQEYNTLNESHEALLEEFCVMHDMEEAKEFLHTRGDVLLDEHAQKRRHLRRRRQGDSSRCAEPHRKIGERSLEILESAIDREDLLVDCAPLRDGGGIEGADGWPGACVEFNERRWRCGGESFPHGRVRFRPAGLWP